MSSRKHGDLVEVERPARLRRQAAHASLIGAADPADVPEELRLKPLVGERGAVELHEGVDRTAGVFVKHPSEAGLAAPARSAEEHRQIGGRDAPDRLDHPARRGALRHHAFAQREARLVVAHPDALHEVDGIAVGRGHRHGFDFNEPLAAGNELSLDHALDAPGACGALHRTVPVAERTALEIVEYEFVAAPAFE